MSKTYEHYLGDAVFAWFDGFYIWLETRDGPTSDTTNAIALEPEVWRALDAWRHRVAEEVGAPGLKPR